MAPPCAQMGMPAQYRTTPQRSRWLIIAMAPFREI
jgi:hypothetical protein